MKFLATGGTMNNRAEQNNATIITWHFVRDTDLYGLHAISENSFIKQIDYIKQHMKPITMERLIDNKKSSLPNNPCLLTFDDAYLEHYKFVVPILERNGIKGVFFPVAKSPHNGNLLDVNKIQFAIATVGIEEIYNYLTSAIRANSKNYCLNTTEDYERDYLIPGINNSSKEMYVKKMLQTILPKTMRTEICRTMFNKFVDGDEKEFAKKLYVSDSHLKDLVKTGHTVGGHGATHVRLGSLGKNEQLNEIRKSKDFLETLGVNTQKNWVFCYPFGSYNKETTSILSDLGCKAAFTIEPRIADLYSDSKLKLPRIDAKKIPA